MGNGGGKARAKAGGDGQAGRAGCPSGEHDAGLASGSGGECVGGGRVHGRECAALPGGGRQAAADGVVEDAADRHVGVWARELDSLDPVSEAIFVRLAILARHQSQRRRDVLAAGGLQHWQFKVLMALRRAGPPYTASPSQLADELGLTRGALSARLAAIEDAGWIVREQDGGDRRRVHVRLTETGNAAFERHLDREERGEAALLSALSPRQRRTLADLLRKLVLAAEDPAT